jgi:hypothetical protein
MGFNLMYKYVYIYVTYIHVYLHVYIDIYVYFIFICRKQVVLIPTKQLVYVPYVHPEASSRERCLAQKGPYWKLLIVASRQYNIETTCVNIDTHSSIVIFALKIFCSP